MTVYVFYVYIVRMKKPAEKIIDRFGGVSKLASALGHKHVTTVHGWLSRGFVPGKQIPKVLRKAREMGIDLSLSDFDVDDEKAA